MLIYEVNSAWREDLKNYHKRQAKFYIYEKLKSKAQFNFDYHPEKSQNTIDSTVPYMIYACKMN